MLPSRIGRYEVLGQLAAGGMAEILLARLSGPGDFKRAVVIKRILRSYATRDAFVKMFLDEARIIASLRHPNVVHVQELGEHEGEAFLVMEYVAGENAASLLKRTTAANMTLEPRLAAHLVAEACAGLHAAHELKGDDGRPQNLVHRDVSPQNLLVGYDGHVKLVDFGVALVEERATRTEPGEVKGKFDYMSPEQGLGKPLDRRSDLFSLGVVLYELSTGRRLFKRPSAAKSIEAICREPILPPSRAIAANAPAFPKKLEAIVMKALAKDPNDRYATAAEMRAELLEIVREVEAPVEALAEKMRALFPDRIAEKDDLLRKVSAGEGLSHVPAGDTDEHVEVPVAPEATLIQDLPQPLEAEKSRALIRWTAATIAAASSAVVIAIVSIVLLLDRPKPKPDVITASPPSAAPIPMLAARASVDAGSDTVLVHLESKPSGAQIFIDDTLLGETPYDYLAPRGSRAITIELRRQGYVTASQQLVPDADQKVLVGLTPVVVHGRPAARPGTPKPHPASSGGFRRFD